MRRRNLKLAPARASASIDHGWRTLYCLTRIPFDSLLGQLRALQCPRSRQLRMRMQCSCRTCDPEVRQLSKPVFGSTCACKLDGVTLMGPELAGCAPVLPARRVSVFLDRERCGLIRAAEWRRDDWRLFLC
jgi:hypothetical protein